MIIIAQNRSSRKSELIALVSEGNPSAVVMVALPWPQQTSRLTDLVDVT